jgi:TIR domain
MSPAPRSVFISHAGSNRAEAGRVRDLLNASEVDVRLDVTEVQPGVSFVAFMESALSKSDYCLLLWSRAAGESKWVRVEWEAALHRAVSDAPGFLVVCRLENHEVPVLLRPRLFVDLFPRLEPGLERVLTLLKDDATAGERTSRPVAKPRVPLIDEGDGATIYVTSKLFGRTFPLRLPLETPVAVAVERIVTGLELPRESPGGHGVNLRFDYGLAKDDLTLADTKSLGDQGVADNDVLWLETSVAPFSSTQPVRTSAGRVTYRSAPAKNRADPASDERRAQDALRARIRALGLQ